MRLQLDLQAVSQHETIPINYNYPIAAWMYHALYESSPDYAAFLHNRGYSGSDGKFRKLFTFSRLHIQPRAQRSGDILKITPRHRLRLYFSSPMVDEFIQYLVMGCFQQQVMEISNTRTTARLTVQRVEALPEPIWTSPLRVRALSPIVVTTVRERGGRLDKHYLRPHDPELSERIRRSLIKKYETLHGTAPSACDLKVHPHLKGRRAYDPERCMSLVTLKEGQPDQTRVKGFLCPMTLTGSLDLIRTA